MAYIGNQPALQYITFAKQTFTANGSTVAFTLDNSVANENELEVFVNNVRQEPGSGKAYTASGTTLTMSEAPNTGDDFYCIYQGKATQTVTPGNGTVTGAMISYPLTTFSSTGIDDNASSTAMTIDSSGRVGIGTSSPSSISNIHVADTAANEPMIRIETSDGGNKRLDLYVSGSDAYVSARQSAQDLFFDVTTDTVFKNNNAETMRIRSDGGVRIGVTNHAQTDFKYTTNYTDGNMARFENTTSSNPYGIAMTFANAAPDDNTRYFLFCNDSSTVRLRIDSDGDVKNHDNSYGALSDERIKQDIRDSNSQWNDIKNIKVRNFKKKDDVRQYGENAWEQIGVIAQELETVSPKLIKHSDPTPSDILSDASFGTLYEEGDEIPEDKKVGDVKEVHQQVKGVSYSVLYMKSIKALQEAMERIEQLETKNTELEARITALES